MLSIHSVYVLFLLIMGIVYWMVGLLYGYRFGVDNSFPETLMVLFVGNFVCSYIIGYRLFTLGYKAELFDYYDSLINDLAISELHSKLVEVVKRTGLKEVPLICLIDLPYLNSFAFKLPFKQGVIGISRKLFKMMDEPEAEALLQYEVSRIKNGEATLQFFCAVLPAIPLFLDGWWSKCSNHLNIAKLSQKRPDYESWGYPGEIFLLLLFFFCALPACLLIKLSDMFVSKSIITELDKHVKGMLGSSYDFGALLLKIHMSYEMKSEYEDRISARNFISICQIKSKDGWEYAWPSITHRLRNLGISDLDEISLRQKGELTLFSKGKRDTLTQIK